MSPPTMSMVKLVNLDDALRYLERAYGMDYELHRDAFIDQESYTNGHPFPIVHLDGYRLEYVNEHWYDAVMAIRRIYGLNENETMYLVCKW